jgi:hypothetical protein
MAVIILALIRMKIALKIYIFSLGFREKLYEILDKLLNWIIGIKIIINANENDNICHNINGKPPIKTVIKPDNV